MNYEHSIADPTAANNHQLFMSIVPVDRSIEKNLEKFSAGSKISNDEFKLLFEL